MPKRLSKILTLLLAVVACIAAAGCAPRFSWSNPIANYTPDGKGLRDPFILKEGQYWYMTGTMSPYGIVDGRHPEGVPLYRSRDLKKWDFLGIMVARPDDSENKWYQERFWAPEIYLGIGELKTQLKTLFSPVKGPTWGRRSVKTGR